jgi:hypothetical protein
MFVGVLAIVVAVAGYILYPWDLFTTTPQEWPVVKELHRGDALTSKIHACKYTPRTADIMLLWMGVTDSGELYVRVLPTTSGSLPEGCKTAVFHVTDVPLNVPPGRYRVKSVMRYDLGLTRVEYPFMSGEFRVLP